MRSSIKPGRILRYWKLLALLALLIWVAVAHPELVAQVQHSVSVFTSTIADGGAA